MVTATEVHAKTALFGDTGDAQGASFDDLL